MKRFIQTIFIASCCLAAFSCNNAPAAQKVDYDGMAKALCECMTPLMEIQQKVMTLSAEGKTDEIQSLLVDVEKMSAEGDKCVEKLESKYGSIEGENEQKANLAFQKACPKVAAMLNQAVEE